MSNIESDKIIDFASARRQRELRPQSESAEAPLPPPDLRYRDLEAHQAIAQMFGLDPRFSLEAQGMETIPLAE